MNAFLILIVTIILFLLAYRFYGKFLDYLYGIDPHQKTPAHTHYDGVDFVPSKNWLVLFGHHFSSICGAGPIVGPVLAVAYWGWAPSLMWIILGAMLMGAVADYSSLVLGMKHEGESIAQIAKPEISPKARLLFSWFIWVAVILVIAVFALFGAKTLVQEPTAVMPSMGLIPTALLIGFLMYKKNVKTSLVTVIGLSILTLLLVGGKYFPFSIPEFFLMDSSQIWIFILLIYCLVASVTPVDILLQPRDYLASFLLFLTIGVGVISIFITQPQINLPAYQGFEPETWPKAGPLFPMLFVTIACGAISGFHSLVSSGTTCKQIDKETHACRIGYGGMLMEGLVAVMVLICVGAGLTEIRLGEILRSSSPIGAFAEGYGNLSSFLWGDGFGKSFAILALNTFILTTLDSATRIARYLTMDLFKIANKYIATLIVIILAGGLALSGQWKVIWPAFGTANQLIAGLSLLVASCWLMNRGKPAWYTLIPSLLMLMITMSAFGIQIYRSLMGSQPDYFIAITAMILVVLSLIVFAEALKGGQSSSNMGRKDA